MALYLYPSLEKHGGAQHRSEGISEVKFSPDGRFLAVGSHECLVDLYVVDTDGDTVSKEGTGLRRVGVCRGASSWITHLTWHKDSRLIQANTGGSRASATVTVRMRCLELTGRGEETGMAFCFSLVLIWYWILCRI